MGVAGVGGVALCWPNNCNPLGAHNENGVCVTNGID